MNTPILEGRIALVTGVRGGPDPDSLNLKDHGWAIPD
jgi:hypothetical protein